MTAPAGDPTLAVPALRADFQGPVGNHSDKYGSRNPVIRQLVRAFLDTVESAVAELQPESILDVGCGEGVVTERLARRLPHATVAGVDLGDARLSAEWSSRSASNLSFDSGSAYELEYEDASMDVVCAFEVLEHLDEPDRALREMARVARSALVLSVPWEPVWRIVHLMAGRDVRSLGNTPGHINHWTARGFRSLAARYGRVESTRRPFPWTLLVVRTAEQSVASDLLWEAVAAGARASVS